VRCPLCTSKVFDSGLENQLSYSPKKKSYYSYYSCERCHLIFVSGKHYTGDQLQQMRIDQVTRQLAEIHGAGMPIATGQRSGGVKRGSGSQANEGEDGGEEEEDAEYEYDDEQENEDESPESSEEEDKKERKEISKTLLYQ
jgi:hypothetical protein